MVLAPARLVVVGVVVGALCAVDARVPSRAAGSHMSRRLGGRLQGAGLHRSSVASRGLEDLSWWPRVQPKEEEVSGMDFAAPPMRSFTAAAARTSDELCARTLFALHLATCMGGLVTFLLLGENMRAVVYADGKPSAVLA